MPAYPYLHWEFVHEFFISLLTFTLQAKAKAERVSASIMLHRRRAVPEMFAYLLGMRSKAYFFVAFCVRPSHSFYQMCPLVKI